MTVAAEYAHLVTANLFNPEASAESVSKLVIDAMAKAHRADAEDVAEAAVVAAAANPRSGAQADKEKHEKFLGAFSKGAQRVNNPLGTKGR